MMKVYDLSQHGFSRYSQNEEDGVLAHVLSRLPERNKYCVEFGANDGVFCSNTYRLISEENYRALYIEGSPVFFEACMALAEKHHGAITARNLFVETEGENSLDNILDRESVPTDLDLLSIDIDSTDYLVWESLTKFRPKVVVVEYNTYIPPWIRRVQGRSKKRWFHARPPFGAYNSLRSLMELADKKGYVVVHVSLSNVIVVDAVLVKHLLPMRRVSLLGRWLGVFWTEYRQPKNMRYLWNVFLHVYVKLPLKKLLGRST